MPGECYNLNLPLPGQCDDSGVLRDLEERAGEIAQQLQVAVISPKFYNCECDPFLLRVTWFICIFERGRIGGNRRNII